MFKLNTAAVGELEVTHRHNVGEYHRTQELRQTQWSILNIKTDNDIPKGVNASYGMNGIQFVGMAYLNPKDLYNEAIGRKKAFSKALQDLYSYYEAIGSSLQAEQKTEIWNKWREAEWQERVEAILKERYPHTKVEIIKQAIELPLPKMYAKYHAGRWYAQDSNNNPQAWLLWNGKTDFSGEWFSSKEGLLAAAKLGGFEVVE